MKPASIYFGVNTKHLFQYQPYCLFKIYNTFFHFESKQIENITYFYIYLYLYFLPVAKNDCFNVFEHTQIVFFLSTRHEDKH